MKYVHKVTIGKSDFFTNAGEFLKSYVILNVCSALLIPLIASNKFLSQD